MKKILCVCLTLLPCALLTAAIAEVAPDPEQTVDLPTLQALDAAPADMRAEGACTVKELYALMSGAVKRKTGSEPTRSTLPSWVARGADDEPVTRLFAARPLYECVEQMGYSIDPTAEPVSQANSRITIDGNEWASHDDCAGGDWYEVMLPDCTYGWIRQKDCAAVALNEAG